jgi:hypothetical protein
MRWSVLALCLAAAVVAACQPSSAPASASGNLGLTDQQSVKAPGASTAPDARPVAAPEEAPPVATLYRQGHETAVLGAVGGLIALSALAALLVFGVPRRVRDRIALPVGRRREERRAA